MKNKLCYSNRKSNLEINDFFWKLSERGECPIVCEHGKNEKKKKEKKDREQLMTLVTVSIIRPFVFLFSIYQALPRPLSTVALGLTLSPPGLQLYQSWWQVDKVLWSYAKMLSELQPHRPTNAHFLNRRSDNKLRKNQSQAMVSSGVRDQVTIQKFVRTVSCWKRVNQGKGKAQ